MNIECISFWVHNWVYFECDDLLVDALFEEELSGQAVVIVEFGGSGPRDLDLSVRAALPNDRDVDDVIALTTHRARLTELERARLKARHHLKRKLGPGREKIDYHPWNFIVSYWNLKLNILSNPRTVLIIFRISPHIFETCLKVKVFSKTILGLLLFILK